MSNGIPTYLVGLQNLPTIDDFERDSLPVGWAPPPQSKVDDFERDSDPASWAPKPTQITNPGPGMGNTIEQLKFTGGHNRKVQYRFQFG